MIYQTKNPVFTLRFTIIFGTLALSMNTGCQLSKPVTRSGQKGSPEELTLVLEEPSGAAREVQPLAFGLPVPSGLISDSSQISILDSDGTTLPVQSETLGTHADGSPRWVFVQSVTALPAQKKKTLTVRFGTPQELPETGPLKVLEGPDSIHIATGAISFDLSRRGFKLPDNLVLRDAGPVLEKGSRGFKAVRQNGKNSKAFFTGLDANARVTILERGPVRARVHYEGKHRNEDGSAWLNYDVWVSACAGSPVMTLRYRVLNFEEVPMKDGKPAYTEEDEEKSTTVSELSLDLRVKAGKNPQKRMGGNDSRYGTYVEIQESGRLNQLKRGWYTIEGSKGEKQARFWALGWADIAGPTIGLGVALEEFAPNFPKGITLENSRILLDIYPPNAEQPLRLPRGATRTHTIHLRCHSKEEPIDSLTGALSTLEPPSVILPAEWYARCGVLGKIFPPRPKKYSLFSISMRNTFLPARYGGAYHTLAFTDNSEYDLNHGFFVQYARTGERNYFRYFRNGTLHTMEKDFQHFSPIRLNDGAFIIQPNKNNKYNLQIDHIRVQGLLDRYFFLGDREALHIARRVGENAVLRVQQKDYRHSPDRAEGWPLHLMCVLYEATREPQFLDTAKAALDMMLEDLSEKKLAETGIGVRTAILLDGLAQYTLLTEDKMAEQTFLRAVDWLIRHQGSPEGIVSLKEDPELPLPDSSLFAFPLLAEAHQWTGDRKYLDAMAKLFEKQGTPVNARSRQEKGNYLRSIFGLVQALDEEGLLKDLDYP